MGRVIGLDIGGSHITLAEVDQQSHQLKKETLVREHVDSSEKKEVILSAWTHSIEEVLGQGDRSGLQLGFAMPGPFDYENGISLMLHGKFLDLYQVNVKKELAARLNLSENQLHFINDAAAFLEGEIYGGNGGGYDRIFGITLGTGLGTTFFKGDVATDEDLWNSPFRDSICEEFLATRWFVKRYKQLTGESIAGVKDLLDKSAEIRKQIFDEYADALSEFIVKYVSYYDPQAVLLGGNIARAYPYFGERLEENLKDAELDIKIVIAGIFEDAAILGAAAFALKKANP